MTLRKAQTGPLFIALCLLVLPIGNGKAALVSYSGTAGTSPLIPMFDPTLGTLNNVEIDYLVQARLFLRVSGPGTDQDEIVASISGDATGSIASVGDVIPSLSGLLSIPFDYTQTLLSPGVGGTFSFGAVIPLQGSQVLSTLGASSLISSDFVGSGFYDLAFEFLVGGVTCSGQAVTSCSGGPLLDSVEYNVTYDYTESIPPVPIPAAAWLFGTALIGFIGFSRRRSIT